MPVSRSPSQPSTSPAEQVAAYLDRLFANRTGIVAVAIGVGGYFDQSNKYTFDTGNVRHRFFDWPEEREKIINLAVRSAKKHDVYVIPNLRSARSAKAGSSLGASYCSADMDRITDTSKRRLEALLSQGSFLVHSGRGLHVYIRLEAFYSSEVIEDLNMRLALYLAADSKWYECALLRFPGTFNHKGRAAGGESLPVVFQDVTGSDVPPWSPPALTELLGPLPGGPGARQPSQRVSSFTGRREATSVPLERLPDNLPTEIRKLLRFNPANGQLGDQSRSGQLHRVVGACMSRGYSDQLICVIAMFHEPAMKKWPREWQRRKEIQRCIAHLRLKHPHENLTCRQAGCQSNADHGLVMATINDIRSHYDADFRSQTTASTSKAFDALLKRAGEIARLEINISQREMCEVASIGSWNTVARALYRLETAGYVKKRRLANGKPVLRGDAPLRTRSHSYRLILPGGGTEGTEVDNIEALNSQMEGSGEGKEKIVEMWKTTSLSNEGVNDEGHRSNRSLIRDPLILSLLDPDHDLWRHRGGLSSTRLTLMSLFEGVNTPVEISQVMSCHIRTVKNHLKKLDNAGLAEKKMDGSWVGIYRPPDDVAKELGTFGMGVMQADKHAEDRERFGKHVELRRLEELKEEQQLLDDGWERYRNIMIPPGAAKKLRARQRRLKKLTGAK
jgi:DNA-binding transcriptional ArsR family regulator